MFFIELIQNTALLVAFITIYQIASSRNKKTVFMQTLFFGFLFGAAGIAGDDIASAVCRWRDI